MACRCVLFMALLLCIPFCAFSAEANFLFNDDVPLLSSSSNAVDTEMDDGIIPHLRSGLHVRREHNLRKKPSDEKHKIASGHDVYRTEISPTVVACHCNGVACVMTPKHMGSSVSVCLYSDFDIVNINEVTLTAGDVTYHPVVDGAVDNVTQVILRGRMAVIKTIVVSRLLDKGMDMKDLNIVGKVGLFADGSRHLDHHPEEEGSAAFHVISNSRMLEDGSFFGRAIRSDHFVFYFVTSICFVCMFFCCALPALFPPETSAAASYDHSADNKTVCSNESETCEAEADQFSDDDDEDESERPSFLSFRTISFYDSIFFFSARENADDEASD